MPQPLVSQKHVYSKNEQTTIVHKYSISASAISEPNN